MPPPHELNFITGNDNKLAEVKAILDDILPLRSQSLDLAEIQGSIEDISKDKCRRAATIVTHFKTQLPVQGRMLISEKVGGAVLTEDTCLCFNALKELPGPYMYVCC